jgi:LysR family nitrogen assimilation transcriptional regulator
MDLRQLRYFVGVVQAGSLSRAADQLHVAQSAISHHLSSLESELDRKLVTRGPKGIKLTEPGRVLYRHAEAILRHIELAKQDATTVLNVPSGRVSIGFPAVLAGIMAYQLFTRVRDSYPQILLRVCDTNSWILREQLINGRLDMAMLFEGEPKRGLAVEPLLLEELFYITADPNASPIRVAEAVQGPILTAGFNSSSQRLAEEAFNKLGLSITSIGEIDSLSTLRRAVAAGIGNTILPWSALYEGDRRITLNHRPFADAKLVRPVSLCFSEVGQRSPAIEAVARTLKSLVRHLIENGIWQGVSLIDAPAGNLSQSSAPPLSPLEIEG